MKKTIFILLTVAALALIGYCCYWWLDDGLPKRCVARGRSPESLRRDVARLKAELHLSDFRGPSERYAWKCPSSISVSNRTFKISNVTKHPSREAYAFEVGNEIEGVGKCVCDCWVYAARYPEAALDRMLYDILLNVTAWPRRRLVAELDEKGNVLVAEKTWQLRDVYSEDGQRVGRVEDVVDPRRFKRTYDNIYMKIDMEREAKDVPCAKDFALPLLEVGASRRFSIFGH